MFQVIDDESEQEQLITQQPQERVPAARPNGSVASAGQVSSNGYQQHHQSRHRYPAPDEGNVGGVAQYQSQDETDADAIAAAVAAAAVTSAAVTVARNGHAIPPLAGAGMGAGAGSYELDPRAQPAMFENQQRKRIMSVSGSLGRASRGVGGEGSRESCLPNRRLAESVTGFMSLPKVHVACSQCVSMFSISEATREHTHREFHERAVFSHRNERKSSGHHSFHCSIPQRAPGTIHCHGDHNHRHFQISARHAFLSG